MHFWFTKRSLQSVEGVQTSEFCMVCQDRWHRRPCTFLVLMKTKYNTRLGITHLRGDAGTLAILNPGFEGVRGQSRSRRVNWALGNAPMRDVKSGISVVAALHNAPCVSDSRRNRPIQRFQIHLCAISKHRLVIDRFIRSQPSVTREGEQERQHGNKTTRKIFRPRFRCRSYRE